MKDTILINFNKERLSSFFDSRLYPLIVAALTLWGSIFGKEIFSCIITVLLASAALWVSDSLKPIIINLCSFVYQISVENSPFYPSYSDYLFVGWRVLALSILFLIFTVSLTAFIIRNKLFREISVKKTPLFLPLSVFSFAIFLNGALSGVWVVKNLYYAMAEAVAHFFVFLLFYEGLKRKKINELGKYFAYISLLIAFIIITQLTVLFIRNDGAFIEGSVNKVAVALGWGIWNLIGASLSVLIPMLFFGMEVSRYPIAYFLTASLALLFAVLTMSRNAFLFGSLSYFLCILIFSFCGKSKFKLRVILLSSLPVICFSIALFHRELYSVFKDFFDRGLSDNGRFALWRSAFEAFLDYPIFGKGFFGTAFETDRFGPLPESAHNTVLQLLSASGIVGLLAYSYFRIESVRPFLRKPSLFKSMLGISILTLLFESLLDNFLFDIYPTFYTSIALSLAFANEYQSS